MSDWMNKVTYDMLNEKQKDIADVIGIEATLKLCEVYGGDPLYIPMNDDVQRVLRDREIRRLYGDCNYKSSYLKKQYGLSGRTIRNIVKEARSVQVRVEEFE